nr:gliding motility-associated C-terminal domain-containing protein [uncultured Psychroserpens sp.]
MIGKLFRFFFFFLICLQLHSQTTDLSIVAQAQNTGGTSVSQVEIFQDFQYIVTIINSGNPVADTTFEITMSASLQNLDINAITSQNNIGGASNASNLVLTGSVLTGSVANLPTDSSVELKIDVTAPATVGGIAINAIISPPNGTTDTNTSNNQSLISIDVIDVDIDFSVTHSQVTPTEGTGISAWNDTVTYQFTITNNSAIDYPLESFKGTLTRTSDLDFGRPNAQLESITCVGTTGGTDCPDVSGIPIQSPFLISGSADIFSYGSQHIYTSGGSATYEIVYRYLDPSCAVVLDTIEVASTISIVLNHANLSPNISNIVNTELLEGELCQVTDICIDTIQTNPDSATQVNWNEEVTFETTVCNNGPLDANIAFFLQNLSGIDWNILSAECIATTGAITCDDVTINIQDIFWVNEAFILPVGATVTVRTVVVFIEPECSFNTQPIQAHIRSGTNVLESDIFDNVIENSAQSDYVMLPAVDECPSSDLGITKTQINPVLPEGGSAGNPTQTGDVTYEITASNLSDEDTIIELIDFTEFSAGATPFIGTLIAVECVSTTGTAECFTINNANIDVPLDGIPNAGVIDVFWQITPEENWILPANSSVTFQATVAWETDCSINAIPVSNFVEISHGNSILDNNPINNDASVTTFFAPCVDLVVQTYPEFTQVNVNQAFDWIIDITNSETSSNAVNIFFEDTVNNVFTITGTPTCVVTNGNATCITGLTTTGNVVTGTIDNMDAGSTIQIRIPVTAPNFGGAYNNIAVATPDEDDNLEISPETNTSISNVQIVAPLLDKAYDPDTIIVGEESTLTFTITNLPSNPAQSDISFTDVFPPEVILVSTPDWAMSNGCTATFVGTTGDNFAGVADLVFPEGVASCSFSVIVTSDVPGIYLNDTTNFIEQNNIDTSQTNATLTVLEDTSDVDIEILKSVSPEEAIIGELVTFEISATNLGTTEGTEIEIQDLFPLGMTFISATASEGIFDTSTFIWSIDALMSNQSETLTLVAQVDSSSNLLNVASLNALRQPDRDESNNIDDAEVTVPFCLLIPQGLSPNDDGLNDVFDIQCIEEYPDNMIKIFNRLGVQIYERRDYKGDWDGTPNMGVPALSGRLPVGTYFYILDLNNGEKPILGWVYLNY